MVTLSTGTKKSFPLLASQYILPPDVPLISVNVTVAENAVFFAGENALVVSAVVLFSVSAEFP